MDGQKQKLTKSNLIKFDFFFLKMAIFYHKNNFGMYLQPQHNYPIKSCIGVLYSLINFWKDTELAMFHICFRVGSLLLLTIQNYKVNQMEVRFKWVLCANTY